MKKLFYIALVAIMSTMVGCKPSEANYRSAYEAAKQKQLTGDNVVDDELQNQSAPKPMVFGADTLYIVTDYIGYTKDGGADVDHSIVKRYCVVVGKFKQVFNARSMRTRLMENGFPGALVLHNRMKDYFVIAATSVDPHQARLMLDSVAADKNLVLKAPFPYILQPRHLVR